MQLAGAAFDAVAGDLGFVARADMRRFRATLRLAGLLHDLGHPPLSHGGERILPRIGEIRTVQGDPPRRTATHEEMSVALVANSDLADLIRLEFANEGVRPDHVAALISGRTPPDDPFQVGGVTLLPLLKQLIASELDVDRMDYLTRDSYFTGVAYGRFDKDWLLSHMGAHRSDGEVGLTLDSNAIFTFEDFLLSRFHMFLMVYFHHKTMAYQRMLERFLEGAGRRIRAPADARRFSDCNDEWLFRKIRGSTDPWASRISRSSPLALAVEAWDDEASDLDRMRDRLEDRLSGPCEWVDSEVEFSKYFRFGKDDRHAGSPTLMVRVSHHGTRPSLVPVDEYSDLFMRQAGGRRVLRIYGREDDLKTISRTVGSMLGVQGLKPGGRPVKA
ncbi:MAG: HD domain-containing protein [Deltaproteobacteria bacterium]|nr:HD domain-containing protein [Deltaproteobacteria bacterium]